MHENVWNFELDHFQNELGNFQFELDSFQNELEKFLKWGGNQYSMCSKHEEKYNTLWRK